MVYKVLKTSVGLVAAGSLAMIVGSAAMNFSEKKMAEIAARLPAVQQTFDLECRMDRLRDTMETGQYQSTVDQYAEQLKDVRVAKEYQTYRAWNEFGRWYGGIPEIGGLVVWTAGLLGFALSAAGAFRRWTGDKKTDYATSH